MYLPKYIYFLLTGAREFNGGVCLQSVLVSVANTELAKIVPALSVRVSAAFFFENTQSAKMSGLY